MVSATQLLKKRAAKSKTTSAIAALIRPARLIAVSPSLKSW